MKMPETMTARLEARLARIAASRPADVAIGGREDPYLLRWSLVPRNWLANAYLHEFRRSDDDRALHDHPWPSVSVAIGGRLREWRLNASPREIDRGDIVWRSARFAHRLELLTESAVTLFLTGPRIREWGFHCPPDSPAKGWRHWRDFTAESDTSRIGRGCE